MNETFLQGDRPDAQYSVHDHKESRSVASDRKKLRPALPFKLFFFIGAVSLIVMTVYGIMTRSATTVRLQQQANQAFAEIAVSVVTPEKAPAMVSLDLPGQTQAYIQAAVFAQTTGYVKKWNFDIGSHVREGDVLAEIETPQVDQQLNQARAQLDVAQAALDLSGVTYRRDADLYRQNVIAAQDVDTAADNYHGNQSTVIADEANVKRLAALEDFKIVKAPFEGIVTVRNTDIGGMVNSGSGNPLFVVARIKPLRVYINVPESMAEDVSVGDGAELKFSEFPERTFAGKVVRTAGAIDSTSRTVRTEVDVPNEKVNYSPALTCRFISVQEVTGNHY